MEKLSTRRLGVKVIYTGVALALIVPPANNFAGYWIAANSNAPQIVGIDVYGRAIQTLDTQPAWKYMPVDHLDTGDLPQSTDKA